MLAPDSENSAVLDFVPGRMWGCTCVSKETQEQKHQLRKLLESYLNTILHSIRHAKQWICFPKMYCPHPDVKGKRNRITVWQGELDTWCLPRTSYVNGGIYKVQTYLQVSTSKMFTAVQCHHTPSSHEFRARWTVYGAGGIAQRLSICCSWKRPEYGSQHLLWVVHNSSSRVSHAFFWPSFMCTETHKQPCSQK